MKNIFYIFFVFSISFIACNSGGKSSTGNDIAEDSTLNINDSIEDTSVVKMNFSDDYFDDPVIQNYQQNSDTLYIAEDCVIFLWPDSIEVEQMKMQNPDSYIDVLKFKMESAAEIAILLDSLGIKNFYFDKSVLWLEAVGNDFFINRKKTHVEIIMYKFGKEPQKLSFLDFSIQKLNEYFSLDFYEPNLDKDSIY